MLENIFLFVTLVKNQSFSKTAKSLKISPATLTRKIQELEKFFGKILLVRDTRNIRLTEDGETVYIRFKDILIHMEEIIEKFNPNSHSIPDSQLRIVLPIGLSTKLINPYLCTFIEQYPQIKLAIIYNNEITDLKNNDINLAITSKPVNSKEYDYRLLRSETVDLYCTPEYAKQFGIPDKPEDLHHHNVLGGNDYLNSKPLKYIKLTNRYTNEKYLIDNSKTSISVNIATHALEIGLSGKLIFGSFNYLCEDSLNSGKIIRVLPEYYAYKQDFYIVSNKRLTRPEQAFIDFIYSCINRLIAKTN